MLSPEDNARRLIMIAKGGVGIAGIDERVLVPNLAGVFQVLTDLVRAVELQKDELDPSDQLVQAMRDAKSWIK